MLADFPASELPKKPSIQIGPTKFCPPSLQNVSLSVIESEHKEQERLLRKFSMVQGYTGGERTHAAFFERDTIRCKH